MGMLDALPQFTFSRQQDNNSNLKTLKEALPQFTFSRQQDMIANFLPSYWALPQFTFSRQQDEMPDWMKYNQLCHSSPSRVSKTIYKIIL